MGILIEGETTPPGTITRYYPIDISTHEEARKKIAGYISTCKTGADFSNPDFWDELMAKTLRTDGPIIFNTFVIPSGLPYDFELEYLKRIGVVPMALDFFDKVEQRRATKGASHILIGGLRAVNIDATFGNSKFYGRTQLLTPNPYV